MIVGEQTQTDNTKRIAKNTLLLYMRMLFTMAVSLYTSRVVLQVLGVSDFGVYNVVGGVVGMFSILSGSLSSAICRFITFELGKGNGEKLKAIFSTAINIQALLAFSIFCLAEIGGLWFLHAKMNIEPDRLWAATWVLHCSILTFMVNLISVPYNALMIAHEHMKAFAYISILDAVLKLVVVFLLQLASWDKMVVYACLLLVVAIVIRLIYSIYCKRHFEACVYRWQFDKPLLQKMLGFAGWNFIGASSGVLKDQGVNIAINLFCGTAVNAARAISVQVNNAINSFVTNFMTALNPQITKSYAKGDYDYMMKLVQQGARLSFYLLLVLSLPVIINAEGILALWLTVVPDHTVLFVRLILVLAMCESLSGTLITAMLATGKIRNYQLAVGGLQMLNFPISYLLLRMHLFPESTLIVAILISLICLCTRLLFLRSMINLRVMDYMKKVLGNVLLVASISVILPVACFWNMSPGPLRFFTVCSVSLCSTLSVIYWIGCTPKERVFLQEKVAGLLTKFRKA